MDILVPPAATKEIVHQCAQSGLKRAWMQPGSESEEPIRFSLEKCKGPYHQEGKMCQATVYLGEEKVAQEIIRLQPIGNGVRLETFFEEPWIVKGIIKEIDFLKHRVFLAPVEGDEDEQVRMSQVRPDVAGLTFIAKERIDLDEDRDNNLPAL